MDFNCIIIDDSKKYRVLGVAIIIALGFVFIIGDQGLKPNVARLRPFCRFSECYGTIRVSFTKSNKFFIPIRP